MFNQKILCLGSNNSDSDVRTSKLAIQDNTVNHGLIDSAEIVIQNPGYYHTSIVDLPAGSIIKLSKFFDTVIFLDQPLEEWSHETLLTSTYKLMIDLDQLGVHTIYKDNTNIKSNDYWNKLVVENKSFCIHPWILLMEEHGQNVLCPRSSKKISDKPLSEIKWQTDAAYQMIRQNMLEGKLLLEHCSYCYNYESKGIESYRQFETKEWTTRLHLTSINDLKNITQPYFYDIRLDNKCNLMCRSCKPEHSHLLDEEFKKFNITYPFSQSFKYSKLDHVNIDTLTPKTRVYLTGGDPTVIPEVYTWMEKCIKQNKVNFDFTLGTNGQKISKKFLNLVNHFTNLNFSISLDGYRTINDYWRWGSNFDTIVKNMHLLESHGHNISILCVPGIYNVTNLHLLLEFLDREFPLTTIYMQLNHLRFLDKYTKLE
jgi:hypothetical protein